MKLTVFKRVYSAVLFAVVFAGVALSARYMENIGRGVVAVRTDSSHVYVGWRMLGTEWGKNIGYHIYRGTTRITTLPITDSTNYVDATMTDDTYSVSPVIDGVEGIASSPAVSVWSTQYLTIPLQVPAGVTTPDNVTCSYSPNDCSVGDLDGDDEYEIVLKWDPSNSQDNSISGYTGNVYLDAYELDGTFLWRIDLGINIRAGAHYTQFIVYDLDSDGKAEVACKTAPGTVDGLGIDVILPGDDPNADYRETNGYILTGPEYLTIFNGQTGAAMVTTNYIPARGNVSDWGDNYGNRVDRFLSCVAYLDSVRPSLVMCRGYYSGQPSYNSKNFLVAWNWRDGNLAHLWTFEAAIGQDGNINSDYVGQGNHNIGVGDVDGDGKDEIIYGACAIDDDGSPFYNTGLGHGNAMHLGDFDPDRPGLEVFDVHEPMGIGSEFRDAFTGEMIWGLTGGGILRGCADDIYAGNPGGEMWANDTGGLRNRYGNKIINPSTGSPARAPGSTNFLVWWDDDHVRELFDGNSNTNYVPFIDKYGLSSDTRLLNLTDCLTNNGTKATPCLSGDILGDWREEVIVRTSDNTALRIYTTTAITSTRLYTLMHDCQYREAIAWQNTTYNQPPHPSFYLGDGMASPPTPNIQLVSVPTGDITGDGVVNIADLLSFVERWLDTDCEMSPELDLYRDCILNYLDFAIFAGNWLN